MTCYWSAAESVPTSLPLANNFSAYHSVTMLNPVTCLINITSVKSQAADGYMIIPLNSIFLAAGVSQTDG
jgi:hypothetical protein